MISTCAQTNTRSATSVPSPPPNRFESAFDTGDQPAGHSFSPSAMRDACHSSSVVTIPAIIARIRSASPRWLPRKRSGRCTLRMKKAVATPASTSTANRSTRNANQPCSASQGSDASRSTAPIIAMMMVGKSTMKPQKMKACISPGTSRCSSFFWPSAITASWRTRAGTSSKRGAGWPSRMIRTSSTARRANMPPQIASAASSAISATGSIRRPPSAPRRRSPGSPRAGRR